MAGGEQARPRSRVGGQAMLEYVILVILIALAVIFSALRFKGALGQKLCEALRAVVPPSVNDRAMAAQQINVCGVSVSLKPTPLPPPTPTRPPPTPTPIVKTFLNPKLRGFPVDHCLSFGQQCDQPAADFFCRSQGFAKAVGFAVQVFTDTELLTGSRSHCSSNPPGCGAFTSVTCRQ